MVSVVMASYNCQDYVGRAIESILEQSYRNFELVVVDGASSDGSVEAISRYEGGPVRLIRHKRNEGISRALNDGIRAARGGLIARMDADDLSSPERLEQQVAVMLNDPELVVLGTGAKVIDQDGRLLYCRSSSRQGHRYPKGSPEHVSILLGIADVAGIGSLREVGLFDDRMLFAEDLELTLRLCSAGRAGNIDAPLYVYRRNASSETGNSHRTGLAHSILSRRVLVPQRGGVTGPSWNACTGRCRSYGSRHNSPRGVRSQ